MIIPVYTKGTKKRKLNKHMKIENEYQQKIRHVMRSVNRIFYEADEENKQLTTKKEKNK